MSFDSLIQDLRFASRLMARQPVLTAAAALTVAFGVGANTAIVGVLETALLNPLGLRQEWIRRRRYATSDAREIYFARSNLTSLS